MTNEDLALRLQETTDRSVRNEGRIKKLEGEHEVLHQLATSVPVMAEQLKTMNENVDTLTGGVTYLCNRDTVNPVYNALSESVRADPKVNQF